MHVKEILGKVGGSTLSYSDFVVRADDRAIRTGFRFAKRAFGDHAPKLAVSSSKSMTGHLLGAAGGLEAAITVLAVHTQRVPPTINLAHPEEGLDLDYVPNVERRMPIKYALSNSFGFGGTNGALLFKKFEE